MVSRSGLEYGSSYYAFIFFKLSFSFFYKLLIYYNLINFTYTYFRIFVSEFTPLRILFYLENIIALSLLSEFNTPVSN